MKCISYFKIIIENINILNKQNHFLKKALSNHLKYLFIIIRKTIFQTIKVNYPINKQSQFNIIDTKARSSFFMSRSFNKIL